MEDIKQFIEDHIPQMDSPEKVYQLFECLGYKTLNSGFRGKEAFGLREKDKETVKEIYTIPNYQKRSQVFLVEVERLRSGFYRNRPIILVVLFTNSVTYSPKLMVKATLMLGMMSKSDARNKPE